MWKALMASGLDSDPPTPFHQGVYLGCSQSPVEVPKALLSEKETFWETITGTKPPVAELQLPPLKENNETSVSNNKTKNETRVSKPKPKPTSKKNPNTVGQNHGLANTQSQSSDCVSHCMGTH